MKITKAKNGKLYYFGRDGKRISEKEYSRRSKISNSRKKQVAEKVEPKPRPKPKRKPQPKPQIFVSSKLKSKVKSKSKKPLAGEKGFRKSTKKRQSSWQRTIFKGKDVTISGLQKDWPINSEWTENIEELLAIMYEESLNIIDDIKSKELTANMASFGYHFSVKYVSSKDGKQTKHEFTNMGFTERFSLKKSKAQLKEIIGMAFDEILDRFQGYLAREAQSLVKLNYITVEQILKVQDEE